MYDYHYRIKNELSKNPLIPSDSPGTLQWFSVFSVPRVAIKYILQSNRHSLQELVLGVGTRTLYGWDPSWPSSCDDLDTFLEQCGLQALRSLTLSRRGEVVSHTPDHCREQLAAVRAALPAVTVLCEKCDKVQRVAL